MTKLRKNIDGEKPDFENMNNKNVPIKNKYVALMGHLQKLEACTIITTGRTGSDFLQSLFDSHTQVLTFNGIFNFHYFWTYSKVSQSKNIDLSDLLDEFIGFYIEKLKSRYDYTERKDMLGNEGDQSLDIDLPIFKKSAYGLMTGMKVNSRNFMLSVYGAYGMCLDYDLTKKLVLLHHIHHATALPMYLSDFPDSKIICSTRDPRANFVSGITHWNKFDKRMDNEQHLYTYIKRIIIDAYSIDNYLNDYRVVRIEDLGQKCILEYLCDWLNINYEKSLELSTWGGLRWRGDRLSKAENNKSGWSAAMLENKWETKLSSLDKYLFNFLMHSRLLHYGYSNNKIMPYDYFFVFLIIILPLRFELKFFSYSYVKEKIKNKNYKQLVVNIFFFMKRVIFFYQIYFKKIKGFHFSRKFVRCN